MSKKIINYIQENAIKQQKEFKLLHGTQGAVPLYDFFLFADSHRIFKVSKDFNLPHEKNVNTDKVIQIFSDYINIVANKISHDTICFNIDELKQYIKNEKLRRTDKSKKSHIKIKDVEGATLYINVFYLCDMLEFYKTDIVSLVQNGKNLYYPCIIQNGSLMALTLPIYIKNKE